MGDDSWPERPTRAMLDQQMPLDRYSPEDRLNVLILHLRARAGADTARLWDLARLLGTPPGAVEALLLGDMRTMHAELDEHGGWPVLASLLAYGGGLDADLDILALAQNEYEEMSLGDQRLLLPVTAGDLQGRGYQVGVRRTLAPVPQVTSPEGVETYPQLVRTLNLLRASCGDPPYRTMSQRAERRLQEWNDDHHEGRSHTALQRVIKPGAKPKLAAVLAFVRGCGVTDPALGRAWTEACARAAVHDEIEGAPREAPRLEDEVEDWIARSPTGPNTSMG